MRDDDPKWLEMCARDQAWALAQADYVDNGMSDDAKWKRCVKSGSLGSMDDDCWTNLIAAYQS